MASENHYATPKAHMSQSFPPPPTPNSSNIPPLAFSVLKMHWILLFVLGFMLNDAGGAYYCRIVMPGAANAPIPWFFTVFGLLTILALGIVDRKRYRRPLLVAILPTPLFILTQLLALLLSGFW